MTTKTELVAAARALQHARTALTDALRLSDKAWDRANKYREPGNGLMQACSDARMVSETANQRYLLAKDELVTTALRIYR